MLNVYFVTGARSGKGIVGEFECGAEAQAWAKLTGYWDKKVKELRYLAHEHCNPPRGETERWNMTDNMYNGKGYSTYGKGWLIDELYPKLGGGAV